MKNGKSYMVTAAHNSFVLIRIPCDMYCFMFLDTFDAQNIDCKGFVGVN